MCNYLIVFLTLNMICGCLDIILNNNVALELTYIYNFKDIKKIQPQMVKLSSFKL
jgi:hypothetical protein